MRFRISKLAFKAVYVALLCVIAVTVVMKGRDVGLDSVAAAAIIGAAVESARSLIKHRSLLHKEKKPVDVPK